MTSQTSICLPLGIRWVPVDRVPRLIVDALHSGRFSIAARTVCPLGKYPVRPGSEGRAGYEPLWEPGRRLLRQIRAELLPLSETGSEQWCDYVDGCAKTQVRPEWGLAWAMADSAVTVRQRALCWEAHRRAVGEAIRHGELVVCNATTLLPETGLTHETLQEALVSTDDLARYAEWLGIGLQWMVLPTETPRGQNDYNRSIPVDWTRTAGLRKLQARDAALLMHGLNPDMHRVVSVPPLLRQSRQAAEFFETVSQVVSVATEHHPDAQPACDWLRWADDIEIVVHSAFRTLAEQDNARGGATPAPLPLTGGGTLEHEQVRLPATRSATPRPLLIFHGADHKAGILDAVIDFARSRALNPDDYQSVWASLVQIARSPERPAPLLGYAEYEGVLYEDENHPCKPLKKEGLKRHLLGRN